MIRYYLAIIRLHFRLQLVYRFEWVMSLLSGFFSMFIQVAIWQALYRGKGLVEGIGVAEMITYVLLRQILSSLSGCNYNRKVGREIQTGNISTYLLRPADYKLILYSEQLGMTLKQLAFDVLPIFGLGAVLFGLVAPHSTYHFFGFVVLALGGVFIMYQFQYIQGLLSFWLLSPMYANSFNLFILTFFGGGIPLWFLPRFFQVAAAYMPFQLIYFIPLSVYLGKIPADQILWQFLLQIAWGAGLLVLEKLVWRAALKKLVVQGG